MTDPSDSPWSVYTLDCCANSYLNNLSLHQDHPQPPALSLEILLDLALWARMEDPDMDNTGWGLQNEQPCVESPDMEDPRVEDPG